MDRSKFQGGSLKSIKETRKEIETKTQSGYSGYHNVDEGTNIFRILPPLPGNDRAYVPLRKSIMKCESEVWENGEPTGEKEVKLKSVFISTVHGDTDEDIVELYCDRVTKKVEEMVSHLSGENKKKERAKLLFPLRGGVVNGKYQGGILPQTSYVCYAVKNGQIGRLELYSTWMKKIEELNIDEEDGEEAAIDRFSDPDNGISLLITKRRREKQGGWEYILKKRDFNPQKYKNWDEFIKNERVTDKQLEELASLTSLEEMFGRSVYHRKDFLLAIDGLLRFDKENKYGIFEEEEFKSKIAEFDAMFPEEDEVADDQPGESTEMVGEDFTTYKLPKLRKYIQDYVDTNYPGKVLPSLSKEVLIEWAVLVENEDELPFDEEEDDGTQPPVDMEFNPESPKPGVMASSQSATSVDTSITDSAKERIERLKNLRKAK